ncbi:MAG: hypothetical protein AAF223_23805, partial [Bacteroidota bacterium]
MNSEQPLRKAIQQLPERSAKPDTWSQIEQQLASEEILQHSVNQLPEYEPQTDIWDSIEVSLANEPKTRKLWWPYATAAAVS